VLFRSHADAPAFAAEVERAFGTDRHTVLRFLRQAEKKYQLTGRIFLEKSLHRWSTWFDRTVLGALLRIPGYDLHRSMHRVHERAFAEPKLVQLFDRFATYNGSNPYRAPGLLSMIPHFEHHFGAYLPAGGMYDISKSLYHLGKDLGVRYHFDTPVDEILVPNGKVNGIRIGSDRLHFDRVVSNVDVFFTYQKLLPRARHPQRILRQQKSTSAIIFYWGIQRRFPELGVHNIFFSDDYRREFSAMEAGEMHPDPTIYVNQTAEHVTTDAPAGHENWFVMINAPYDRGQDWGDLVAQTRSRTLAKLNRMLGVDLEPSIAAETHLDPRTIESRTGSHLGALYGTSSNNPLAAFLRHPNFSNRIGGLYFVGGSAHPGGGIPLCLLSAKITAELIIP
jgi:phytoene desaturase